MELQSTTNGKPKAIVQQIKISHAIFFEDFSNVQLFWRFIKISKKQGNFDIALRALQDIPLNIEKTTLFWNFSNA